ATGAFIATAIGGAVVLLASQMAGNLMGLQDGLNWKSVALSSLSAGFSSGLNSPALLGGSGWEMTAMRYATANVLTQGVGMVTGLQSKFDWKSVAASAAGGAVQSVVGDALQGHALPEGMAGPVVPPTFAGLGDWGGDLAHRTVTSFASGVTTAVMRGGRISVV
ncbi:hypothetical protein, partial [Raoultella sp. 18093]|uniref:hypothetical protein n=1 Tax=Raoultella sp. 18093 TaxID=2681425 RepID=UPI00135CB5CC